MKFGTRLNGAYSLRVASNLDKPHAFGTPEARLQLDRPHLSRRMATCVMPQAVRAVGTSDPQPTNHTGLPAAYSGAHSAAAGMGAGGEP